MKVPTTLPEGEGVHLFVVDDADETPTTEHAELEAALEKAEPDIEAGRALSEAEV